MKVCKEYKADWLLYDQKEVCRFWIIGQACRLADSGPCIWEGQPPNLKEDRHGENR